MTSKRRVAKFVAVEAALPGETRLFPGERLLDMPLAKRRQTPGHFVFTKGSSYLQINNLEEPLLWQLGLARTAKTEGAEMAADFSEHGSRHLNPLTGGVEAEAVKEVPAMPEAGVPGATIDGMTEFGLQTDDDHEYFLSKFGDLVGVLRVQRKGDGSWKAGLEKSNVPRVLSPEAVADGLMPPPGHSGLPKSLEAVVPTEYQYWKAQGETARQMRDALVEQSFFSDDTIKAVDGELRKVEVKYFVYEPGVPSTEKSFVAPTLGSRVQKVLGEEQLADAFAPMTESQDWLEALDQGDAAGRLAILSPVDRSATSPREMARAVKSLHGDFLLEHDDTRLARSSFASVGLVFKLHGEPTRVFGSSFVPAGIGTDVQLLKAASVKTVDFQGLSIYVDRPAGFVQTGKDEAGTDWSREYLVDYGFLAKTQGGDGMELDVFVGPTPEAKNVYWVSQNKSDGSFDEFKLFVGFETPAEARGTYFDHIPAKYYGGMSVTTLAQVKALQGIDPVSLAKRLSACAVEKINGISLDEVRRAVNAALDDAFPADKEANGSVGSCTYVQDLYPDTAVFSKGYDGRLFQVGYTYANGAATLDGTPTPVLRTYVPATPANTTPASPEQQAQVASGEGTLEMRAKRETQAVELVKKTQLRIAKAAPGDQHYVLGIVLEPDVVDAQNDTYSADEVRAASEKFMELHRNMGLMHKQKVNDKVQILENYIAPVDMQIGDETVKKGTWLMGVRVADAALWKAVKDGDLTGFSIGGSAIRTPTEQEV